jgi:hypothetical protein
LLLEDFPRSGRPPASRFGRHARREHGRSADDGRPRGAASAPPEPRVAARSVGGRAPPPRVDKPRGHRISIRPTSIPEGGDDQDREMYLFSLNTDFPNKRDSTHTCNTPTPS